MDISIMIILFILSLGLIAISCIFFNNAMNWLGKTFELEGGTTGSILSIIGTSLPQVIIPFIAFTFLRGVETIQIGLGAILGAPFVLSTLGFFITGYLVLSLAKKGEREKEVDADFLLISRDIKFFLISYTFAIFAGFLADKVPQIFIGLVLITIYGYYLYRNVVYEEMVPEELYTPLYFAARGEDVTLGSILFQLITSLIALIGGAGFFVHTLKEISLLGGAQSALSGLILAVIFAPLVIEIPSKLNLMERLKAGKDTLAIGEITSSLIFQSCVLVTLGILFSPWKLEGPAILVGCIPIVSATIFYISLTMQEKINPYILLANGGFYLVFILGAFCIR
ncbi:MAG: hypothetical protein QME42_06940 [bacterium]|nr:hypothetical protein [bacterium]